jgi:hypothetical protein
MSLGKTTPPYKYRGPRLIDSIQSQSKQINSPLPLFYLSLALLYLSLPKFSSNLNLLLFLRPDNNGRHYSWYVDVRTTQGAPTLTGSLLGIRSLDYHDDLMKID